VDCEPLMGMLPDQAPEAEHERGVPPTSSVELLP